MEGSAKRPLFGKAAIIGVGLIGGSLALVMKKRGLVERITGIGRGMENLETALSLGIVDDITQDPAAGVEGADLVVVAVPVQTTADVVKRAAPGMGPGTIVTDVGSVKGAIADQVPPLLPDGALFVPAHPVAGTEKSGAEAAFPELFEGRLCVITPVEDTDRGALEKVKKLWQEAGMRVVEMDPLHHDRIFSAVSHLPHVAAYCLVNTVAGARDADPHLLDYSAGGFRDFTRIASSPPEMWTGICALNSRFILEMIERYEESLSKVKELLEKGDLAGLREEFERARAVKDSIT